MIRVDRTQLAKAAGIGIVTALGSGLITAPLFKLGIAPMPQAPSQAFAETLFGAVPDVAGMLMHLAYVTAVTTIFLLVGGLRPTLTQIAAASFWLWVIAVAVMFPIVGWGVAGAAVSLKIGVAAVGPHVLYAAVVWTATRALAAPSGRRRGTRVISDLA